MIPNSANTSWLVLAAAGLALPVLAAPTYTVAMKADSATIQVAVDGHGQRVAPAPGSAALSTHTELAERGAAAWAALGPFGGHVNDVAASPTTPSIVLAGTTDGGFGGNLYRSIDTGASWQRINAMAGRSIQAIDFASTGVAWVGAGDGVWSSSDDGQTWTRHELGIGANQNVQAVTVAASDPAIIWVGIADALGSQPVTVMRSTDAGATWNSRTPPLPSALTGSAVALDPADPDIVAVAFTGFPGGGAIWVSEDGGSTWADRSSGLPAYGMNALHLAGDRLLVGGGQLFGSQYFGLYVSDDLGATWTALHDASWPLPVVTGIAVDPADPDVILATTDGAGVNRSVDGGASWETGAGDTGNLSLRAVNFVPGSSDEVLLGATSLGVFVSSDGGDAYTASSTGIAEFSLFSVHANPLDPDDIAVAFQGNNSGGVLRSTDGGQSWQQEDVPGTRYSRVRYSPDGVLHALSSGPTSIAPEGLYQRQADGSWIVLGPDQGPLFESDLAVIRFSNNDPDRVWLGGSDFGVAGFEQTVWYSDDAGATWTKQFEGFSNDFTTDIEVIEDGEDQHLLAVYDGFRAEQQGGAIRSDDGGVTWTYAESGLPVIARQGKLCASPTAPQTLFAVFAVTGGGGALYRTDNAGTGWSTTGWTGSWAADVVCDVVDDQVLYIAQQQTPAVLQSLDQGLTFQAYDDGLDGVSAPRELVQTADGGRLLLASGAGAYATAEPIDDVIFADGFEATLP